MTATPTATPRSPAGAIDAYLAHRQLSRQNPRTTAAYARDLDLWRIWLNRTDRALATLGGSAASAFRGHLLAAGDSPATANRRAAVARGLQAWCAARGWCPPPGVLTRTVVARRVSVGRDTLGRLLSLRAFASPYYRNTARDEAIFALMYEASARVVELSALDLADYAAGVVRLSGFGRASREVSLSTRAAASVEAYLRERRPYEPTETALFLSVDGYPLSSGAVTRACLSATRTLGLPHFTARMVRNARLADLAESDLSATQVARLAGVHVRKVSESVRLRELGQRGKLS